MPRYQPSPLTFDPQTGASNAPAWDALYQMLNIDPGLDAHFDSFMSPPAAPPGVPGQGLPYTHTPEDMQSEWGARSEGNLRNEEGYGGLAEFGRGQKFRSQPNAGGGQMWDLDTRGSHGMDSPGARSFMGLGYEDPANAQMSGYGGFYPGAGQGPPGGWEDPGVWGADPGSVTGQTGFGGGDYTGGMEWNDALGAFVPVGDMNLPPVEGYNPDGTPWGDRTRKFWEWIKMKWPEVFQTLGGQTLMTGDPVGMGVGTGLTLIGNRGANTPAHQQRVADFPWVYGDMSDFGQYPVDYTAPGGMNQP